MKAGTRLESLLDDGAVADRLLESLGMSWDEGLRRVAVLIAKVDQRRQEARIGALVGGLAVAETLAPDKRGGPFLVRAADGELEIGAGKAARKAAMLQHDAPLTARCGWRGPNGSPRAAF